MGYSSYQVATAPTFLKGPYGAAWMRAHGIVKDYYANRVRQAVQYRFPQYASADALAIIGDERGIARGATESDASYAARLVDAWDAWTYGGTPFGILSQLQASGYIDVLLAGALGTGAIIFDEDEGGDFETFTLPWFIRSNCPWNTFDVLFDAPLPSNWLDGGLTSVFHGGTGTGVVTASGTPTVDNRFVIWITTGGVAGGGTAEFSYSLDNGDFIDPSASNITIPNGDYVIPDTGITINFSGTFTTNDVYSFAPTFNVPVEDTGESALIKSIVNTWKPAFATVDRYIIHTSGNLSGWPVTNRCGAPPAGGTSAGIPVYCGGSTAIYWGP